MMSYLSSQGEIEAIHVREVAKQRVAAASLADVKEKPSTKGKLTAPDASAIVKPSSLPSETDMEDELESLRASHSI